MQLEPSPTISVKHSTGGGAVRSILVVKLDHLGDFIIGLPALEDLRAAFPLAFIRLICGAWNSVLARDSALVDEVCTYTYFPQNARNWDGQPCEPIEAFEQAAAGHWDLAIDLRVDDDTRFLLRHVDAGLRCGIGPRTRHPFLDIALPPELEQRFNAPDGEWGETLVPPEAFTSRAKRRLPGRHEFDFASDGFLLTGPGLALPRGWFRVLFDCDLRGRGFGARKVELTFDAYANGASRAARTLHGRGISDLAGGPLALDFESPADGTCFEFRIHSLRRPFMGRLGFKSCRVQMLGAAMMPRLRRVELHIGEKLSLLVCLVRDRTRQLYSGFAIGEAEPPPGDFGQTVVIAPISNSTLRDWPAAYYTDLISHFLEETSLRVLLVGSGEQAAAITALAAPIGHHPRLENIAGTSPWSSLPTLLRQAALVVCNNSGIAHMAAGVGAPTLAIYSASHEPAEWGPRGAHVRVLTHEPPCAPCGHDSLPCCRYGHVCMTAISPRAVFGEAQAMLQGAASAGTTPSMPAISSLKG